MLFQSVLRSQTRIAFDSAPGTPYQLSSTYHILFSVTTDIFLAHIEGWQAEISRIWKNDCS